MLLNNLIPFGFLLTAAAQSITDVVASNPDLSTLNKLLQGQPAIVSTLSKATDITVLAPSNAAFDTFLKSEKGAAYSSRPDVIGNLLTYHVLNGTYKGSDFSQAPRFPHTLLTNSSYTAIKYGQVVKAQLENSSAVVTSGLLTKSRVITPDVAASNGVIHIIDTVLMIPAPISETANASQLNSLVAALKKANLVETVDKLPEATIFAPTDDAFTAASGSISKLSNDQLKNVLTYHVLDDVEYSNDLQNETDVENLNGDNILVKGKSVPITVNSANIVTSDVLVSNGVVHVVDGVLAVNSGKNGTNSPHSHNHVHDHDDHDDHDHKHSAAGPSVNISKRGVIALSTFILAQLSALYV